jgi:hypothetical protein
MDTYHDLSKGFILPRNPITSILLIPVVAIPILFVSIVFQLAQFAVGQGGLLLTAKSPALPEKKAA